MTAIHNGHSKAGVATLQLPCAPDAERATLGSVLIDPGSLDTILQYVSAEDFYIEDHRQIFAAFVALAAQGIPGDDMVALNDYLYEHHQPEAAHLISELVNATPTYLNAAHYARTVADRADRRRIFEQWQSLAAEPLNYDTPPDAILGRALSGLSQVQDRMRSRASPEAQIVTAAALRTMDIPEPHLIVAGIIPEGLTILGGRPKMGKSWLALNLALSVSRGAPALGYTSTEAGDVLYLALEDRLQRLHSRMQQCCSDGSSWPEHLAFATRCPTLDAGGLAFIENWLKQVKQPRMVIADTFAVLRGNDPSLANGNQYAADYAALTGLKRLADDYHVGLVAVHHLRKSGSASDDPLEELSGTNAISGAADNILVLKRTRGETEGTLNVAGRDIEEQEYAVRFDPAGGWWNIAGNAAEARLSRERQEVLTILRQCSDAMSPSDISAILGKPNPNTRRLLHDMQCSGEVQRVGYGKYRPANT